MKINKTILIGALCILFAGVIFLTNAFNPVIRPITHLFLMGSSKGKDIILFGLLGLFLILSQLIKKDIDSNKYLKISIVLGGVLLILGILLEVIFRMQMGIKLNTVFCSMTNGMSSTSILHTHLLKSILGEVLTQIIGPFIQSDINTGVGLYAYLPSFAFLVILLIPVLFATSVLSSQKRLWPTNFLTAFFSSCLLIGIIDGFNYLVGRILKDKRLLEKTKPIHRIRNFNCKEIRFLFKRYSICFLIIFMIFLRFTIAFAGAEPDYYTVDIVNPTENVDLGNISVEIINYENNSNTNKTTYHIDPSYNEMELINDLKVPLNNSCEYYTVSWNIYSYL